MIASGRVSTYQLAISGVRPPGGLLSVLIFPVLALATLPSREPEPAEAESAEPAAAAAEPIPEPHLM